MATTTTTHLKQQIKLTWQNSLLFCFYAPIHNFVKMEMNQRLSFVRSGRLNGS